MLPSHYFDEPSGSGRKLGSGQNNDDDDDDDDPFRKPRLGGNHPSLPLPPPSLCVTGAMSRIGRFAVKQNAAAAGCGGDNIVLYYIIFRPRQLHSLSQPPLVCLHGGPSIPSNYMLSIVNTVTDRSIVFYDQYGCGKSSRPSNVKSTPFAIAQHVEHLRQLLEEEWKLTKYHLLGHSWGGILAFEFLKQQQQEEEEDGDGDRTKVQACCCSLVFSSTPTSASLIQSESQRLYQKLSPDEHTADANEEEEDKDMPPSSHISQSSNTTTRMASAIHPIAGSSMFQQTHECRLPQMPLSLIDSLAQVGPVEWRGLPAIREWRAQGCIQVPTLVLRGEYDCCTPTCIEHWKDHISSRDSPNGETALEYETLSHCSHYCMMEDERQYGTVVTAFLHKRENNNNR